LIGRRQGGVGTPCTGGTIATVTEKGRHHKVRIDDSVQVSDSIRIDVGRGLEGIRT
jgi:hypothetical protein